VGAAVFVPGADMPVLTLNQIRLVLRIADAHGFEVDRERIPELLAVLGSGFGFRALAREALGAIPVAGWALKGAVAYGGTRALGEAAVRYFERRAPVTRVAGSRARFPRRARARRRPASRSGPRSGYGRSPRRARGARSSRPASPG